MCLLAFGWQVDPEYALVVCANRDEFYARPTQTAHFWPDHPHIFGGRDVEQGGSWMGISQGGRFAAITNIRNPATNRSDATSRGLLVSEFLEDERSALDFCLSLQTRGERYNGYNFLAYDGDKLVYQSNRYDQPVPLAPGVYGLSNATLDISWPKTVSAVKKLNKWLVQPGSVDQLALLLNDRSTAPDQELPATGVSLELERVLSAQFIAEADYGTRCSTGVLVHRSGQAEYCEVSHDDERAVKRKNIEGFLTSKQ